MTARLTAGDSVQTPFGRGTVRQVQNNGRVLVDVEGRSLVVPESQLSAIHVGRRRSRSHEAPSKGRSEPRGLHRPERRASVEVDLHGFTVEEALVRVEQALNDALLADLAELRVIHGRSGGRLRAALQRQLREIPSVRGFRLDPRNQGVTIVSL
jgi:DNA mismatch repair protein MutS2